MMLSHYYNRKASLDNPAAPADEQQSQIIDSFYQERRSRSHNPKHHNLLRKNISYFDQHHQLPPQPLLTSALVDPQSKIEREQTRPLKQEHYKQRLKNQLRNRISITNYLTQIQQHNKENVPTQTQSEHSYSQLKVDLPSQSPSNSRISITRILKQNNKSKTIESLSLTQNSFEFTKNQQTERTHIAPISKLSHQHSNPSSAKKDSNPSPSPLIDQVNVLMQCELASLNENSYPLRQLDQYQPKSLQNNSKYFQSEQQIAYKRRISDLQQQLQSLKSQKQRESKLIASIFKMRRTLLQTDTDCSLKQLWRWLKHLPCPH